MKSGESEIFKKYRVVNQIASSIPLMTANVNETVHVVSVSETSYAIYDARKMNLVFCGPMFQRIHCAYQKDDVVYVGSYRTVHSSVRGEIAKSLILPRDPVQSNKRVCVADEENVVRQIAGFGNAILILTATELFVTEDLDEMYKIEHSDITGLYHPHTYVNKILQIMGCRMVLFNISSRKDIYAYTPFDAEIRTVEQTPVIDIVGVGLQNGTIHIFNLKTDKVLFSFKVSGAVTGLSFGGSHLVATTEAGMFVFDLDEKKSVISRENSVESCGHKENVLSARFLDDKSVVVSTGDSISIFEIEKYSMELIKRRRTYNGEIVGMEFADLKNVVVFGPENVFSMNLYRDELGFEFKFKGVVEMQDVNENIVCFGKRSLHSLDLAEKNSRFILNKNVACLAVYKDFCCLGSEDIVLVNLKSKLVHSRIGIEEDLVDLAMDFTRIAAATSSGICLYSMKGTLLSKHEQTGIRRIRIVDNFVIACTETQVLFYDESLSRAFTMADEITDYSVSRDVKWIAILCGNRVFLYDILTTSLLDILVLEEEAKFVKLSPKQDFLLVASVSNNLILYSNKSLFGASVRSEEMAASFARFRRGNEAREMRWERTRNSFYMELLLLRGLTKRDAVPGMEEDALAENTDAGEPGERAAYKIAPETLARLLDEDWIAGLNKEQVLRIMELVVPHTSTSMEMTQEILFRLLKHKSHLLEPRDVYSFHETFDREWRAFEDNALRTIGYLNMEANGLL